MKSLPSPNTTCTISAWGRLSQKIGRKGLIRIIPGRSILFYQHTFQKISSANMCVCVYTYRYTHMIYQPYIYLYIYAYLHMYNIKFNPDHSPGTSDSLFRCPTGISNLTWLKENIWFLSKTFCPVLPESPISLNSTIIYPNAQSKVQKLILIPYIPFISTSNLWAGPMSLSLHISNLSSSFHLHY